MWSKLLWVSQTYNLRLYSSLVQTLVKAKVRKFLWVCRYTGCTGVQEQVAPINLPQIWVQVRVTRLQVRCGYEFTYPRSPLAIK